MTESPITTRIQTSSRGALVSVWLPAPYHEVASDMAADLQADLHAGNNVGIVECMYLLAGLLDASDTKIVSFDAAPIEPEPLHDLRART